MLRTSKNEPKYIINVLHICQYCSKSISQDFVLWIVVKFFIYMCWVGCAVGKKKNCSKNEFLLLIFWNNLKCNFLQFVNSMKIISIWTWFNTKFVVYLWYANISIGSMPNSTHDHSTHLIWLTTQKKYKLASLFALKKL